MSYLPIIGWWTMTTMALQDLEKSTAFGVNTLIIENNCVVEWNQVIDGLAMYDFSEKFRRTGSRREPVDAFREQFRKITESAKAKGIRTYVMCPELHLPQGFTDRSFENPDLWYLIGERLREVFRALPNLDGFMLYLCEGEIEVFDLPSRVSCGLSRQISDHLPRSKASPVTRVKKLIDTVWDACRAENRALYVTTFIHRLPKLKVLAEALRSVEPHPDFSVVQYCCPSDWGLYALLNPAIGDVGKHTEILGFDYAAENWGQGVHPFVHVDFMAQRLEEAQARSQGICGITGYVAWYGKSVLDTLNEANVYAGTALARNQPASSKVILQTWCTDRFGSQAAQTASECLARTFDAVFKAQHIFGYWLDTANKSGVPSLAEMDEYFIGDFWGEALAGWDDDHAAVWKGILDPDEAFLNKVLQEKEEALSLCRSSIQKIQGSRHSFEPEDYRLLERNFTFQELWARIWRDYVHAFFLRQMARRDGTSKAMMDRLERVISRLLEESAELEERFGVDVFPRGPEKIRSYVIDLKKDLSGLILSENRS